MITNREREALIEAAEAQRRYPNRLPYDREFETRAREQDAFIAGWRAAAAVFEAAQKPSDDEREAVAEIVERAWGTWWYDDRTDAGDLGPVVADALLTAGFRRPVSPEPSVDEVLVEGSWFKREDLPTILGNFMRTADERGREIKELLMTMTELKPASVPSAEALAEIEKRVYEEHRGQIAGMAQDLVRAGWDAALRASSVGENREEQDR